MANELASLVEFTLGDTPATDENVNEFINRELKPLLLEVRRRINEFMGVPRVPLLSASPITDDDYPLGRTPVDGALAISLTDGYLYKRTSGSWAAVEPKTAEFATGLLDGSTELTVNGIDNGEFLKRSGTDIVSASLDGPLTVVSTTDDGSQDDYAPGGSAAWQAADMVIFDPAASMLDISGFEAPTASGKRKKFYQNDNRTVDVIFRDTDFIRSSAGNLIRVGGTGDYLNSGAGGTLIYDDTNSIWRAFTGAN